MKDLMLIRTAKYFMDNPYQEVYLRELAKKLGISPFAAKKHADLLVKRGLIKEERKANLRYLKANSGNLFFKHLKIAFNINTIASSGLLEFLQSNTSNLSCIILFGSMAKGEDDAKSDVDILVIGKGKQKDLSKFENKIGKDIIMHEFSWSEWNMQARQNTAFYSDIVAYGIPLFGERPVVLWK
jgi:hypothetical protein